ncbi:MAG: hypothetical protein FJ293_15790 [Planctomycetes bacterium]|nr:hypothetical protein [Planctomycetota bacterium]
MNTLGMAAFVGAVLATGLLLAVQDATPAAAAAGATQRVGVYDSRGVAIAFASSKHNDAFHAKVKARYDAAKQAGDTATVANIEAEMQARQKQFHLMGFARADVSTLLEPIAGQLPAFADRAGIDVLVSKWDVDWVRAGVALVDVTEELAQLFEPKEQALKWVREIRAKEPLPATEVDHHD